MTHPLRRSSVGDVSDMGAEWSGGIWLSAGERCEPILVAGLTYIGHDGDLYSFV